MYTYIIIDDEILIRRGLLKKINYYSAHPIQCIGEADNGEDGLKLIASVNPDIIFTDMRMPVMDGKQLLKKVSELYPDKKLIVLSGYSDFEYMQEAISAKATNYLLKPFNRDEIHLALDKAILQIESEQGIKRAVEQKDKLHEQLLMKSDFQILTSLLLNEQNSQFIEQNQLQSKYFLNVMSNKSFVLLLLYSTVQIHKEILKLNDNSIYIQHPQTQNLAFILMGVNNANQTYHFINSKADDLIQQLSVSSKGKYCISISQFFNSFSYLRAAHLECVSALDQRELTEFGKVFSVQPDRTLQTTHVVDWDKVQMLLYDIECGQTEKVKNHVLDFFAYYLRVPNLYLYEIKGKCRGIIIEVKKLLATHWNSEQNLTGSSSLEAMFHISFHIESMKDYMIKTLTGVSELMKEQAIYSHAHVIDNVKKYIQTHYMRELTLDRLSSLFYLNPSYLSHLFKEYTSQNLTDYINQIRIEQAKSILVSSNEKINKITKRLGFENEKYFFRIFKKLTGLTPDQYRKAGNQK